MEEKLKSDRLCLLPIERLTSMRPYSNISEYCLRDGQVLERYFLSRGVTAALSDMSDFDLLAAAVELFGKDGTSFVSRRLMQAINEICRTDTSKMTAEEIWSLSARILDEKSADEIFGVNVDEIGLPYSDKLPDRIGNAAVKRVACPFGIKGMELDTHAVEGIERSLSASDSAAVFFGGFEFAIPNEYAAQKAAERLVGGGKLSHKEAPILASQLCRELAIRCADEGRELMAFMPPSPDVRSMGEFAAFLDYADGAIKRGRLNITVFASDAVGYCFANSVSAKKYKKITAETGICGNGCGCAGDEDAAYWGVDALNVKRASLASSPAFIGK